MQFEEFSTWKQIIDIKFSGIKKCYNQFYSQILSQHSSDSWSIRGGPKIRGEGTYADTRTHSSWKKILND